VDGVMGTVPNLPRGSERNRRRGERNYNGAMASKDFSADLAAVEANLDRVFQRELGLSKIPKPAAREALLDVMESLLTGQGKEIDASSGAMVFYFNNLTKGASSALRAIERFASERKRAFSRGWDVSIRKSLSTCLFFSVVEDAFFTCWKGYSVPQIEGQNVSFEPLGSDLDARLRFFRSPADFSEGGTAPFDFSLLTSKEVMEGVARSLMATEFKPVGGFEYQIEQPVVEVLSREYQKVFEPMLQGALNINLGGITSRDLFRAWCILLALARLHWLVRLLTAKDPSSPNTSFVLPALYRKTAFWLDAFGGLPNPQTLLGILTFDPVEKAGDICVTPIVRIQDGYFGLIPSSTLRSNIPRNLLVLIASRFSAAYSMFSLSRESLAVAEYRRQHPSTLIDAQINLPKWNGSQLPDIDLLFGNADHTHLVVAELKWQLSASTTREVVSRNDYLKKGSAQLVKIRDFLLANPDYLRARGLTKVSTTDAKITLLLLCRGHLGSETVMTSPDILLCDDATFFNELDKGLEAALRAAETFSYLPLEGKDFMLRDVRVKFGDGIVGWKAMVPPSLTEDTETALVEAFYMDGARFAVL